MGNPTAFLEIDKKERNYEDPKDRLKHFKELQRRFLILSITFILSFLI